MLTPLLPKDSGEDHADDESGGENEEECIGGFH